MWRLMPVHTVLLGTLFSPKTGLKALSAGRATEMALVFSPGFLWLEDCEVPWATRPCQKVCTSHHCQSWLQQDQTSRTGA